jgi:hypothetical protein
MTYALTVPMAAHVAIVTMLYLLLTLARAPRIWEIGKRADGSHPFAAIEPRISANLSNQFEWPVLFYAACMLLMMMDTVSAGAAAWAWCFIAGRLLHSLVQILTRNIRLRGLVFMINFVAVLALWLLVVEAATGST